MTTRVIFRIERDGEKSNVVAVFPDETNPNRISGMSMACYAHIGQHSSMAIDYYRTKTKPAKLSDAVRVQALRNELESMGYDLKIVTRR